MNKVTIIVPVYNVEKYLERCIHSLIQQTYSNIEIILVDDYSSDNSRDIISKYVQQDERIHAIYQEKNKGVSAARNCALEEMKGEWVCFCDSDDWYEKTYVEKMVECSKKEKADYVICDYQIVSDKRDPIVSGSVNELTSGCNNALVIACGPLSSCTHMIKKELFDKYNISYPENCHQYEELAVIPVLAKYAKRIGIVKEALYNYYQRGNGTSASNYIKNSEENFYQSWNIMCEKIGDSYKEELDYHMIYALFYGEIMNQCKRKKSTKEIKEKICLYKKQFPDFLKNPYIRKMGLPKKLFLWLVDKKIMYGIRILSKIHGIIVN